MFDPVCRSQNGPIAEYHVIARIASAPQTGPTPIFGSCHQTRTQRISFDISAHVKRMQIRFDRNGFVAALVNRSGTRSTPQGMPSLRMRAGQPVHEPAQIVSGLRPDDKVPMVWHYTICQHTNCHSLHCLQQNALESRIVPRRFEQRSAPNPTVKHVIDEIVGRASWTSGHRGRVNATLVPQV